ncbi:MAG: aquaporin [Anaerolineales bacterium]
MSSQRSQPGNRTLWKPVAAELVGTALLVAIGVSFVIFDFGQGSPMARLIPSAGLRRLLTGFLFGSTGAVIALSPIGKISGAHINPVVSAAFWLVGKLRGRHALANIAAQCLGGVLGALPLLLWGNMGRSVQFGATLPGPQYGMGLALGGEIATTFALVALLFAFLSHPRLRPFTPALFPVLYALMVWLEAPISGTSTNPARSLGPMLISLRWQGWWIYWVGPALGMVLAVGLHRISWMRFFEIEIAKLYHFEHDPEGWFSQASPLQASTAESQESPQDG